MNTATKLLPPSPHHFGEKFMKKAVGSMWPRPHPSSYITVVQGPHGSGASKIAMFPAPRGAKFVVSRYLSRPGL